MTAFNLSVLSDALDDVQTRQCSASLNGQAQRCSKPASPIFIYPNLNTYLCSYHETYMKGDIFRKQVPDFEGTALLSDGQPASSEMGTASLNAYSHRNGNIVTVFSGSQLDDLTTGLHPAIKANILRYIQDYLLFLDDSHYKHEILKGSKSQFGARYRQFAEKNNLGKFETECKDSGCVFVVQVNPTEMAVNKMNINGRKAASDGLAVMIGFTTNLQSRLGHLQKCSIDDAALSTFPPTSCEESKYSSPVGLVELLAGIVHEILIAHQHDIWCPCTYPNGRTHTQVYWFRNLPSEKTFEELMGI
ncbi:hypothetical protein EC991_003951 [Linnemannia zychae]|nr:hypothetical protein EC991_003951 [Linnemannia zychae]